MDTVVKADMVVMGMVAMVKAATDMAMVGMEILVAYKLVRLQELFTVFRLGERSEEDVLAVEEVGDMKADMTPAWKVTPDTVEAVNMMDMVMHTTRMVDMRAGTNMIMWSQIKVTTIMMVMGTMDTAVMDMRLMATGSTQQKKKNLMLLKR
jgi:hypothetical protein